MSLIQKPTKCEYRYVAGLPTIFEFPITWCLSLRNTKPNVYPLQYTLPKLSNPPHPPPPKSTPSAAPAPGSESAVPTITLVLKSGRNPNMTLTIPSVSPLSTSIHGVKEQIQSYLGGPSVVHLDKIKVLLNKKPVPPSKKTVADALDGSGVDIRQGQVEMGVMVMGGAPDPPPQEYMPPTLDAALTAAASVSAPPSEKAAMEAEDIKVVLPGASASTTGPGPMEGVVETNVSTTDAPPPAVQPGGASGASVLETPDFWDDLQGFLAQRIRSEEDAAKVRGVFEAAWRSSTAAP